MYIRTPDKVYYSKLRAAFATPGTTAHPTHVGSYSRTNDNDLPFVLMMQQQENNQQQQHSINSPRNSSNTSYNNESSLLMCGPNTNGPSNTHLIPNSGLTSTITTPSNPPYPPTISPLYANTASPLTNAGAGKSFQIIIKI